MKTKNAILVIGTLLLTIGLYSQEITSPVEYSIAEQHKIYSNILEEERELLIYTPSGFWGMDDKVENYPIVIVLDGESQFLHTLSTIDFLSAAPFGNDILPRSIVVGIPNTNRNRDLTPTNGIIGKDSTSIEITGGGKNFMNFIVEEVIPFLETNFSTSNHRTLIGHSLGGLMVFEALLYKREYFNNYLAIDPGLGFDNGSYFKTIIDTLRTGDLRAENLF